MGHEQVDVFLLLGHRLATVFHVWPEEVFWLGCLQYGSRERVPMMIASSRSDCGLSCQAAPTHHLGVWFLSPPVMCPKGALNAFSIEIRLMFSQVHVYRQHSSICD